MFKPIIFNVKLNKKREIIYLKDALRFDTQINNNLKVVKIYLDGTTTLFFSEYMYVSLHICKNLNIYTKEEYNLYYKTEEN